MKRFATPLAVLTLAGAALAQNVVTEKIPLRFTKPSRMAEMLSRGTPGAAAGQAKSGPLLPQGIEQVSADDRDMTLTVWGAAPAVAQMKEVIRLLDVQPRLVGLKMRLVRVEPTADGKREEKTIAVPETQTLNNVAARVSVTQTDNTGGVVHGWAVEVLPKINGDRSVTLSTQLRLQSAGGAPLLSTKSTRRIENGKRGRVVELIDPRDRRAQNPDPHGKTTKAQTPPTYYLEITPTDLTPDTR